MSGFACIFHRDVAPVSHRMMEDMLQAMAHRGPEGKFVHVEDTVGLGHLLLKTGSGTQREQMPARSADGRRWITGDLRLDDRKELWNKLGLNSPFDPTVPDSQLVLHAYEKWGEQCPGHLLGDFSFVLWDAAKCQILAARDPFGVKPFYYHLSEKLFAAGSEIKALTTVGGIEFKLSANWLIDYLVVMVPDFDSTVYESIRRLSPATCLTVTPEKTCQFKYWALEPGRELRYSKDSDYVEHYRELFFKANERRLDCLYPVGSHLSGGMDSSSIVCASRKILRDRGSQPFHTFSTIFSASDECDETQYIQSVLEDGGVTPHFFDASDNGPLADFSEIYKWIDEPRWAYNLYCNWGMLKCARSCGVRVLLDGFDGDTTLSHGECLFNEWAHKGQWIRLFKELRARRNAIEFSFWPVYRRLIWRHGLRDRLPHFFRRMVTLTRGLTAGPSTESNGPAEKYNLFAEEFAARNAMPQKLCNAQQQLDHEINLRDHKQRHLNRLQSRLLPYALETQDTVSAAQGIERRYPFFDRELAEFCFALPWHFKLHHGMTRVIARKALENVLPEKIRHRPDKADLSFGLAKNLQTHDRDVVRENLIKNKLGILENSSLRRLNKKFLKNQCTGDEILLIWRVAALNIWLEKANECVVCP